MPLTTKPISIKPTGGRSPGLNCFTFAPNRLYDVAQVAAWDRMKRQWKILLPRPWTGFPVDWIARGAAAISTGFPLICGSGTISSNFSFSGPPPHPCGTTALIAYLPMSGQNSPAYSASPVRIRGEPTRCSQSWTSSVQEGNGLIWPDTRVCYFYHLIVKTRNYRYKGRSSFRWQVAAQHSKNHIGRSVLKSERPRPIKHPTNRRVLEGEKMADQESRNQQQHSNTQQPGSEQRSGNQPNQPAQQKHDNQGTQPKGPQSEHEKRDQEKKKQA
jgi:hypothetical protein